MIPQHRVTYPDGIAVKTEAGVFYLKGNLRWHMPTERIVNSWGFTFIPASSEVALSGYAKAGKLGFRDGSLIKAMSDRSLYLISGQKRRKITNPDWFNLLDIDERNFVRVSDEELFQKEGENLV